MTHSHVYSDFLSQFTHIAHNYPLLFQPERLFYFFLLLKLIDIFRSGDECEVWTVDDAVTPAVRQRVSGSVLACDLQKTNVTECCRRLQKFGWQKTPRRQQRREPVSSLAPVFEGLVIFRFEVRNLQRNFPSIPIFLIPEIICKEVWPEPTRGFVPCYWGIRRYRWKQKRGWSLSSSSVISGGIVTDVACVAQS